MSEPTTPPREVPAPAPLRDKVPRPQGLFPRHLQTWFVAGIAGLIVLVVLLTGQPMPTRTPPAAQKAPPAVDANQIRIQEYRDRIDEQVRRLQAEQAELALTKQALTGAARPPVSTLSSEPAGVPDDRTGSAPDAVEHDQAQRAYRALYADNVAWAARQKETPPAPAGEGRNPSRTTDPASPASPGGLSAALTTALTAALSSSRPPAQGPGVPEAQAPTSTPAPSAPVVGAPTEAVAKTPPKVASTGDEPTFPLLEGTLIDAVLTNRLDGSSAGPVNAMVTTPVYAKDFQHVLIPAGSRLLGSASPVSQFGQQRLAVAFHRLVFPDGRFISLDKMPALNQRGDAGLRDQVDQHYLQIFGTSLAIGALAGLAQVNTSVGLDQSWSDTYRQGVGSSVTQSSMRILDRFLNRLPTVTIREGHRLKVYLTSDLALPVYRGESTVSPLRQKGGVS